MFNLFKRAASSGEAMTPERFVTARDPEGVVIDVRTPSEYRQGHLEGARNIDVSAPDFATSVSSLDKDGTYYVYCRSGSRSGAATRTMKGLGFTNVTNVGGIDALVRAGAKLG